jgi:hypothetical protein
MVPDFGLPGGTAASHVEEIWREDFEGLYEEGGDVCFVLTTRRSSDALTGCAGSSA